MENHTLPMELMREILLRLPVRSVSRCKCVCKSWNFIISNPQFGNSHYDLDATPSHRLILRSNYSSHGVLSIDTNAPLDTCSAAKHLILPLHSSPCNPYDNEDYDGFPRRPEILGSCRGFILLYYKMNRDLIIWNPLTRDRKLFLNSEFMLTFRFLYGFGYDTSTDDYLLILIRLSLETAEIQVFSFKTNRWNRDKIEINVPYYSNLDRKFSMGLFFNDALYWVVFSMYQRVFVIIAFDLVKRSLSEIPLFDNLTMKNTSDDLTMKIPEVLSLRVIGGCLCVCCLVQYWAMPEIWVMKESSWTKWFVIPYDFSPICITKDGGILGLNIRERLEKYNNKGELFEHFTIVAAEGEEYYCSLRDQQSAMYRESQLSLP